MARFKLGNRVAVRRELPWSPQTSYGICRELLAGYEAQGFTVDFEEEAPPERVEAQLTRGDGTRLTASVQLALGDGGASLELSLRGTVVVGGAKGMFATDSIVRKTALERLESYLDKEIRRQRDRIPADGAAASAPTVVVEASEPAPTTDTDGVELVDEAVDELVDEAVDEIVEEAPLKSPPPSSEPAASAEALVPGSVEYRLRVLQIMLDRGLIDAEDFAQKKQDILLSL